jgi:hypothetical protein
MPKFITFKDVGNHIYHMNVDQIVCIEHIEGENIQTCYYVQTNHNCFRIDELQYHKLLKILTFIN